MERYSQQAKTLAILSYITIVGWIIALLMYNNDQEKSPLAIFHIRQALGIYITGFLLGIAQSILSPIPVLGGVFVFLTIVMGIGLLVLWLMGLISAAQEEIKEVPLVGDIFQSMLSGLK